MIWIPFFSQTGSEIANLVTSLGFKPELIATNNIVEEKWQYHPGVRDMEVTMLQANHNALMQYFETQTIYDPKDVIITLHGYLRIIPKHICEKYTIYNGHPANIRLFPELKGLDPQVRTWENRANYPIIGSVVHKVTPGVDEGPLVKEVSVTNNCKTLDEMFEKLKQTSLWSWEFFLREKFYEDRNRRGAVGRQDDPT